MSTAILILGVLYLLFLSHQFRMVALAGIAILGGAIAWAIDYGSDKPQTWFYNSSAHPAYKLAPGEACGPDRHMWNGWCVK